MLSNRIPDVFVELSEMKIEEEIQKCPLDM
jgi:hypothetical protein